MKRRKRKAIHSVENRRKGEREQEVRKELEMRVAEQDGREREERIRRAKVDLYIDIDM